MKKKTIILIIVILALMFISWYVSALIFSAGKYEQWERSNALLEEVLERYDKGEPGVICSTNFYNCEYFKSQAEAQELMRYCMGEVGEDIHYLDGDDDGIACETLP